MKRINLLIDKRKTYVIACSFGPDSMALLNEAFESGFNIVVAHVNYHKRDVSNFEEQSLCEYCKKRNIPFECLDTNKVKKEKKNFQEWAREIRYEFFRNIAVKYNCFAVLVAHQEDDLIETYLMQKNRGNSVKYKGIAEENDIFGVKIIRPLLKYSKQFLKEYDDEKGVPYSIDESNLTDDYTRNKIRHQIVENMSKEERKEIVDICLAQKIEKETAYSKYQAKDFKEFSDGKILTILDYWMNVSKAHRDISKGFIAEIKKALGSKRNVQIDISQYLRLEKNYDTVYFVNRNKLVNYEIHFENCCSNEFIEIDFSNGTEDRGFDGKNRKLIVRNLSLTDVYKIKNYKQSINRLFIDWKMPIFLRKVWPGIYNENGELIYVPRYRENYIEKNKSKFKILIEYFQSFEA